MKTRIFLEKSAEQFVSNVNVYLTSAAPEYEVHHMQVDVVGVFFCAVITLRPAR